MYYLAGGIGWVVEDYASLLPDTRASSPRASGLGSLQVSRGIEQRYQRSREEGVYDAGAGGDVALLGVSHGRRILR